jgi:hypothetical protein
VATIGATVSKLGIQFCWELAFGVLLALAFVPRAPVGSLFYRIMGSTALVLLASGVGLALGAARPWSDPGVVGACVACAAFPLYSGPVRGRIWGVGLAAGMAGAAFATFCELRNWMPEADAMTMGLAGLSALATGTVAGSVGLAMVLGHWYLTVPNLGIAHLERLNRVTIVSMGASLALVLLLCLLHRQELNSSRAPLFGAWGLFHLGTRVAVGLLMPLLFAWMAASSLRYQNTRSATGILYASTVLVLIGTAVSLSLQGSYGLPL